MSVLRNKSTAKRCLAAALSFILVLSGAPFIPKESMKVQAVTPVVKQVTLSISKLTKPKEGWSTEFTSAGSFAFAKDSDVTGTSPIHTIGFSSYVDKPDKWKAAVSSATSTTTPTLTIPKYATGGENYSIEATFRTSLAYDQMSAIIYNSSANSVIAYGKIGDVENGSHTFKMPAGIAKGSYTLWVFLEKFNTDKADQIYTIGKKSFTVKESGTVTKHDLTIDFSYPIKLESGDTSQLNLSGQMSPVIVTLDDTKGYYFPENYMADKSPIDGIEIEYIAPARVRIYGTPERLNTYVNLDPPSIRKTEQDSEKYSVKILNVEEAETKGNMILDLTCGAATQNDITGMMKTIVFKAKDGYYFDYMDYLMKSFNGVHVTRAAVDEVRVSGVPTADVTLTMLEDIKPAKEKTTPDAPENVTADTLRLVGTTKAMEYADAENPERWYSCTGGTTNVTAGLKYVRYKATDISYSGRILEVNVPGNVKTEDNDSGSGSQVTGGNSSGSSNNSSSGSSSGSSGGGTSGSSDISDSSGSNVSGGYSGNTPANTSSGGASGGSSGQSGSSGTTGSANSPDNNDPSSNHNTSSNGSPDDSTGSSNSSDSTFSNSPDTSENKSITKNDENNLPDDNKPANDENNNAKQGYTVTIENPFGTHVTIWSETENYYHQTNVTGNMKNTSYYANAGYYFPADYSVAPINGIKVKRNGATRITVYGTPTADTVITLLPASLVVNDTIRSSGDSMMGSMPNATSNTGTAHHSNTASPISQSSNKASHEGKTTSPSNASQGTGKIISANAEALETDTHASDIYANTQASDNNTQPQIKKLKPVKKKLTIRKGRSAKLKVKITTYDTNKAASTQSLTKGLTYKSSDKRIATVNSKGKVKGVHKGKCVIYITAQNGVKTKVKIKVK